MAANRMDVSIVSKKNPEDQNEKGFWTKVGVMFEHKDGKGWSIHLDALPVNGDLVARIPLPKDERKSEALPSGGQGFNEPLAVGEDGLPF